MASMIYLPVIDPADYEAFRALMPHALPETFDGWYEKHRARTVRYPRHTLVPVTPVSFRLYCHSNSRTPDFKGLLVFAEIRQRTVRADGPDQSEGAPLPGDHPFRGASKGGL